MVGAVCASEMMFYIVLLIKPAHLNQDGLEEHYANSEQPAFETISFIRVHIHVISLSNSSHLSLIGVTLLYQASDWHRQSTEIGGVVQNNH